jgi:uncharacterized membrane protein
MYDMHREGSITLYNHAVVVKDAKGNVAVKQPPYTEPVGTFGGMLTGGLIGVLGGPVGAALGLGAGTLVGAAFDLTRAGIDQDFVNDVGTRLEPGKAAVIAEIDEQWQTPLDTRMEFLGGKVLRKTRMQIEDTYLEEDIKASEKELATLEAEKLAAVTAAQTEKSKRQAEKLQAKIDAAKREVQQKQADLAAKLKSVETEGKDKVAALEAQKATATQESQALLNQRQADVRRDYEGRIRRMKDTLDRQKKAHATVGV